MGYGARALEALNAFYSGEYLNLSETPRTQPSTEFRYNGDINKVLFIPHRESMDLNTF